MDVRKFPRQEKSAYKTLKYPGIEFLHLSFQRNGLSYCYTPAVSLVHPLHGRQVCDAIQCAAVLG